MVYGQHNAPRTWDSVSFNLLGTTTSGQPVSAEMSLAWNLELPFRGPLLRQLALKHGYNEMFLTRSSCHGTRVLH